MKDLSRRDFLRSAAVVGAGFATLLAGCQPKIVEVEKVVTKEVIKEVEVEKEVTKVVEKVVKEEVEKEVTRVVEKEIMVKEGALPWTYMPLGTPYDGKEITLEYWDWHQPRVDFMNRWFARYSETYPNVSFDVSVLPWSDFWTKMKAVIPAGQAPDIHQMHQAQHQVFTWGGLLAPMPEEQFPLQDLKDTFVSIGGWLGPQGRVYWLPIGAMSSAIFYNKAMFEAEGMTGADIPGTWDGLRDFAKSLTKSDSAGRVDVAGLVGFDGGHYEDFIWRNEGIWLWDEDYTRPCYAQEPIIDAMQYLVDMRDKDNIIDPDFLPWMDAFVAEKSYMAISWTWFNGWMKTNAPNINFGVVPNPTTTGDAAPCAGNGSPDPQSIAVPATTDPARAAAAFDLIAWMFSNPDHLIDNCITLGSPPAVPQLLNHPLVVKEEAVAAVAGRTEYFIYTHEQGAPLAAQEYNTIVNDGIWKLGVPVKEAVFQYQEEIDRLTAEYVEEIGQENFQMSERSYYHADEMDFGDCLV